MNKIKRSLCGLAMASALCGLLTACGGGGDSDNASSVDAPVAKMTLSVTSASLSADELTSASTSFFSTNAAGALVLSHDYSGDGSVDITESGNKITVTYTAPELIQDQVDAFTISVSDGDVSKKVLLNLHSVNASVISKLEFLSAYVTAMKGQTLFSDLDSVYRVYNTAAVFINKMSPKEADSYQDAFSDTQSMIYSLYEKSDKFSSSAVNQVVLDYKDNLLNEDDIDLLTSGIQEKILGVNTTLSATIGEIASLSDNLPSITPDQLSISGNGLSPLVGNAAMGAYVNEKWVFNDEYSLIEKILSSTCTVTE
jgi:hypothetical protein